MPIPMPKTVCRTNSCDKIAQLEVCVTFSGRGVGTNITARNRRVAVGREDLPVQHLPALDVLDRVRCHINCPISIYE